MRYFKSLLSIFLVASFLLPTFAQATEDKEAFSPAGLHDEDKTRVFSMGGGRGLPFSQLGQWPDKLCKSTADPKCNFKDADWGTKTISARAILPKCDSNENNDCIESIQISGDRNIFKELTFERYIPDGFLYSADGNSFPSDVSKDLPTGSRSSIWYESVDGKVSDLKYLATYSYDLNYDNLIDKFIINSVNLDVRPFKEVDGVIWGSLWSGNNKTGVEYEFRPNTSLRAAIHLSKKPAGWFKARMKDVNIEIAPLNAKNNRLVVDGTSVAIPNFAISRPLNSLVNKEAEQAKYFGYLGGVVYPDPGDFESFKYIEYWRDILKDTAPKMSTYWNLSSTRWTSSNACLQDSSRVLGIVSTNSMAYDGSAPAFKDGFLNYRVSGFHYLADGATLNLGTYDLVMRSDAARCLYGFSSAPVSATVSITGAGGENNVATTVVSEKNGWLKMKAAGFTFSEKNIKVKLSQEGSETVIPVVKPMAAKKSTITCVAGKKTKKVSGTQPKCPKGFKVK